MHKIQVCGDPTVDWFRIHNEDIIVRGGVYYWQKQNQSTRVKLSSKPGGAAMVLQLLDEMIPEELGRVEGITLDEELLNRPKDDRVTTSWTVWREFSNPGFDHSAFRIEKWHEFEPGYWDYPSHRLTGSPDLLLIQDNGLGFRSCEAGWPEALSMFNEGRGPHDIIIKLGQYNDMLSNPLLDRITQLGWEDRTTIVSTLSDLRSCSVKIGISLSWERMLGEVIGAVLSPYCPFLDRKSHQVKYKQIIITIGASRAVMIDKDKSTLIFDRNGQEGDFANQFPGQMMGYNTCILGSLATAWAENPEQMDWTQAAYIGVELARRLHINGYEAGKDHHLHFPNTLIARDYRDLRTNNIEKRFSHSSQVTDLGVFVIKNEILLPKIEQDNWTILEENLLKKQEGSFEIECPQSIEAVVECARKIVVEGPLRALPNIPVETMGAWCSADRQEIEGVLGVNNALQDYLRLKNPDKPLCVAVFGPPGAGKSFVVKEMAKGLGIEEDAQLTFNLSQFNAPDELLTAFYQVRDLKLKGKMPLVFWDEFDNPCEGQNLGWLRYFLAPMQDGEFSDQGATHPLGGGIYVFAGATRHSFEKFRAGDNLEDRTAKKPDFISRLRAYINIRGINGQPNTVEDKLYMIRRAFILRQYLENNAPQIKTDGQFEIDAGVLDAFLRVTKYSHGARSMENLVKMSSLADKRKFELSSLPPDNIVAMHTNVKEFNALTRLGHREILRIGIAGNIDPNPHNIENIEACIDDVIQFIEQHFPDHYLTVFSTLAMGANRLVARHLLKKDESQLIVVLPVPKDEYIYDLGTSDDYRADPSGAELRQEFKYWLSHRATETILMSPSVTRKAAYEKADYFIAEHSDILIVVWDGENGTNSSITADIAARVEKLHKPICHIRTGNDQSTANAFEENTGSIQYHNFTD